jgi:DNA-binding transcriptional regulator YhcF (GntR family)
MSIHYISQAWKTPVADAKAKLVLLKLADNANDEGIAWPHIETIAAETGLSRSSVFKALNELENGGIVERDRGRNEVIYRIQKSRLETSRSPDWRPLEVQTGDLPYIKEPSIEHIGTTNNPETPQKRFQKPSVADVLAYGSSLTPKFLKAQQFIDYYESKGWVVGKAPMKCWKSAIRTWQARDKQTTKPQTSDQFGI